MKNPKSQESIEEVLSQKEKALKENREALINLPQK